VLWVAEAGAADAALADAPPPTWGTCPKGGDVGGWRGAWGCTVTLSLGIFFFFALRLAGTTLMVVVMLLELLLACGADGFTDLLMSSPGWD